MNSPTLSKNLVLLVIFALVAIFGIGAVIMLLVVGDVPATFTTFALLLIGVVTAQIPIINLLNKQGEATAQLSEKIERTADVAETIKTNTNGTLSAKDAEITALRGQLTKLGHTPVSDSDAARLVGRHAGVAE